MINLIFQKQSFFEDLVAAAFEEIEVFMSVCIAVVTMSYDLLSNPCPPRTGSMPTLVDVLGNSVITYSW